MPENSPQITAERIGHIKNVVRQNRQTASGITTASGINSSQLERSIAHHLSKQQLEYEAKIEKDPMTGLLTYDAVKERIPQEINRAKRLKQKAYAMVFDMNGLKAVNDNLGHDVGDYYIRTGADILTTTFRPVDLVARRGEKADEFLVIFLANNIRESRQAFGRLQETTKAASTNWEGFPIVLPAGVAEIDPTDIEGSIKRADHAMYESKALSRETGMDTLTLSRSIRAA